MKIEGPTSDFHGDFSATGACTLVLNLTCWLMHGGRRLGFEIKRTDALGTGSATAEILHVVHAGVEIWSMDECIAAASKPTFRKRDGI